MCCPLSGRSPGLSSCRARGQGGGWGPEGGNPSQCSCFPKSPPYRELLTNAPRTRTEPTSQRQAGKPPRARLRKPEPQEVGRKNYNYAGSSKNPFTAAGRAAAAQGWAWQCSGARSTLGSAPREDSATLSLATHGSVGKPPVVGPPLAERGPCPLIPHKFNKDQSLGKAQAGPAGPQSTRPAPS